jgi:cobalt-precorrin-5B (C1)-methyltransferase
MSGNHKKLDNQGQQFVQGKRIGNLRTGYTTGTSAAAATKAAVYFLINREKLSKVDVTLPKGKLISINIKRISEGKHSVTATVIKDAGDDPDVTNNAQICSTVSLLKASNTVVIDGGTGVGRVTKPGLGLKIGNAAINPVPRTMIEMAVKEVMKDRLNSAGIYVVISVPDGAEIAKKTDNPRLGIVGGISILGTSGIVIPYSTASFAASIRQSINVTLAMGSDTVLLTTGGRSEDFIRDVFKEKMAEHSYIQIGDFIGYAIKQCADMGITKAVVAGFIGKLTKMGMGIKQTHVKGSKVDMIFLSNLARECGADDGLITQIKSANTARHVYDLINAKHLDLFYFALCDKVHNQLSRLCNSKLKLKIILFDFEGRIIGKAPNEMIPFD